jgi:hypothetical protein
MREELDELKSELKSCREIIRILREETQVFKTTPHEVWNIANGDQIEEIQDNT